MDKKYISSIEIDDIVYNIKDNELREKFNSLIKDAPEALDTLKELADALGNNPNLVLNMQKTINKKPGERTEKGGEIFNDYEHNKALSEYSHAEGYGTTASGDYSHAEGYGTTASGDYSHAEGYGTTASSYYSHAEGEYTKATHSNSHAEGIGTKAINDSAHAEGNGTEASGNSSHASGWKTKATAFAQMAIGKANAVDSQAVFIVGNGTSDTDRNNAFVVRKDGSATLQTSGTNDNNVVTYKQLKDYVAEVLKNLVDVSEVAQ